MPANRQNIAWTVLADACCVLIYWIQLIYISYYLYPQTYPLRGNIPCATRCLVKDHCEAFYLESSVCHLARSDCLREVKQVNSSSRAVFVDESKWLCPDGYKIVNQDLDGTGKEWSLPHPDSNRTLQQCADICTARSGCTSFEYANGPSSHGACGTYTGGNSNLNGNHNRNSVSSNWYSCIKE